MAWLLQKEIISNQNTKVQDVAKLGEKKDLNPVVLLLLAQENVE